MEDIRIVLPRQKNGRQFAASDTSVYLKINFSLVKVCNFKISYADKDNEILKKALIDMIEELEAA